MKNTGITAEYSELDDIYKIQYKQYIILLQVGSFYEMYSSDPKEIRLRTICELLNIILTKKDKSIVNVSKSNPWMAGFPCHSLEKYLDILISNNYTVIVYNQYTNNNSKIKRKLHRIYSIGTYLDSEKILSNDNLIMSIFIEQNINSIENSNTITGISIIDLSTGSIKLLELYNEDINKLIEELNKEFIIYNPKEVILTVIDNKKNVLSIENPNSKINKLINFLQNKNIILHHNLVLSLDYFKLHYQNEFFEQAFQSKLTNTLLSTIEYLDLERYELGRLSLLILLKFAFNHDNNIINYLNKPDILMNKEILNLHNNALYQLNILSIDNNYKYNSLFDILNKTSTNLGKRYLKYNLSEPITNINELNHRYSLIDKLQKNNKYLKYEKELNNILDIEKYHKKLGIKKLLPFQYGRLNKSYLSCIKLITLAKKDFNNFNYEKLNTFLEYYTEYSKIFNIDNLELYNYNSINHNLNIFNLNIIEEIDNIYTRIQINKDKLTEIIKYLSELINNEKIEIKYTDRDGYYLTLTKIRANKLKVAIDKLKLTNSFRNDLLDIGFNTKTQSYTYINSSLIKKISKNILLDNETVNNLIKVKYSEISTNLYIKYHSILNYLNKFISYLDLIKSNTKCSIIYNYHTPVIIKNDKSFINCESIRHPISEQLHLEFEYVSNDISLNSNKIGCLLYGSNGVGKSTLMKSIGLNIIMAQIGSYVAASKFEYMPYNKLFTRIDHSDNLFKGLSSFESEILELKTILNCSDKNSLILGDEILNSTENISAISIISSSINYFLLNNISFIFASHLHQIPDYINNTLKPNLNICHLSMDYDSVKKTFIYTRKLLQGPSIKNYGLIVANSLLNNEYIINSSLEIQNKILNENNNTPNKLLNETNDINPKKSKYNSKLIMNECYICKDLNIKQDNLNILETHHIIFQSNFDSNNKCILDEHKKNNLKKNQLSNLVNLCKYHHIEVHKENIIINKWTKSVNGKFLDYKIILSNNLSN